MVLSKYDEAENDQLNPAEQHARNLRQQEDAAFDDIADNYEKDADDTVENDNIAKARNAENNIATPVNPMNYRRGNNKTKIAGKGNFWRKKGPTLAVSGTGIIAIIGMLFSFFGAIMPIDLMERITSKNDSTSTAFERRAIKTINSITNPDKDPICQNSTKHIKCRMGRISNKALNQLSKKGMVAVGYDGSKTGYPAQNPTEYDITAKDGETIRKDAKELPAFLAKSENRKFAATILGTQGAFNLRLKAYTGKYVYSKFYNKFGLRFNGGIADGQDRKLSSAERLREGRAKLLQRIPGSDRIASATGAIRTKIDEQTKKARRGGVAYMLTVAGCVTAKAPSIVASGVAAVQLAQVLPFISEVVLSPGSKAKASGVVTEDSFTQEDAELVGTLMTEETPRESDGKMTSALDSKYLLAALGVNTARLPISSFSPGYSVLTHPAIVAGMKADENTRATCNVIMSPAAMWSAFAVDSAVTVAASATIIGGIVKIGASWVAGEIIAAIIRDVAGKLAQDVITELATNEDIPNAKGEKFGDIMGISAMGFFSARGMAGHLPVLSESQITSFNEVKQENIAFERDLELATTGMFDPTSQYSITGSIVSKIQTAALENGTYGTPLSIPAGILSLPFSMFSEANTANAASTEDYCSYADEFGLDTGNPKTTPAINAAGLPCTGINKVQADMGTEEAIDLLIAEGWLVPEPLGELADSATIDDLVAAGVIPKDTPLHELIVSCSDASSGDYIFTSGGCITPDIISSSGPVGNQCVTNDNGEVFCTDDLEEETVGGDVAADLAVGDPRAFQAMSTFLIDYQVVQSINGEDEGIPAPTTDTPVQEVPAIEVSGEWTAPMVPGSYNITSRYKTPSRPTHNGIDLAAPMDTPYYAASGGRVTFVGRKSWGTYYVTIDHGNGISTEYGHSYPDQVKVKVGDLVEPGQLVGLVGNQGNIITSRGTPTRANGYGAHLHFNYLINGKDTDPEPAMQSHGITL